MIAVPRLAAEDRLGLVPLRLVVWVGAGIAVGPLVATADSWLFGSDLVSAYGRPVVLVLWLVGLTLGVLGGCVRPRGLTLGVWSEIALWRLAAPVRARVSSTASPPLATSCIWVVRSRPGGMDTYVAEKHTLELRRQTPAGIRRLCEAQRWHAADLMAQGTVRQTECLRLEP